jgi:uncharacterized protein
MNRNEVILMTEEFVRQRMKDYDSGHDWWHIERVRRIAKFINEQEALADPFMLDIAVLLHDTADSKFAGNDIGQGYALIEDFMNKAGLAQINNQVIEVITNVSFSKKNSSGNLNDPVLLILQDADRLDAIGAIGIARAFNYGGFRNNSIYIPVNQSTIKVQSTIGHFYDKLLKLKDMMNTHTGQMIAEERHLFLEKYLEQFYKEWEFGTGITK